jgi:hypothetical protein
MNAEAGRVTPQGDRKVRAMEIANLRAMCAHVSTEAVEFQVSRVTTHLVYVRCRTEAAEPEAVLPLYRPLDGDPERAEVVVWDVVMYRNVPDRVDPAALFAALWDCPRLVRRRGGEWVEARC